VFGNGLKGGGSYSTHADLLAGFKWREGKEGTKVGEEREEGSPHHHQLLDRHSFLVIMAGVRDWSQPMDVSLKGA